MTPKRPSYEFFMLRGPAPGAVYPLSDKNLTVGRDPLSDIAINDPEVSRQHALVISTSAGDYHIQDLGSTNGTFIDGARVGSKPETLRPSNAITMGAAVTFIFRERTTGDDIEKDDDGGSPLAVDDAPPAQADSKSDAPESIPQGPERVQPNLPVGKPVKEGNQAKVGSDSDQRADAAGKAGDVRQPAQIEQESSQDLSPNLILGFMLLILCSCATAVAFLLFLRGDWFLRQAGLVP